MSWIKNIIFNLLVKLEGGDTMFMISIIVGLIAGKRRTIDECPDNLKSFVLEDLKALGLDGYGDLLVSE